MTDTTLGHPMAAHVGSGLAMMANASTRATGRVTGAGSSMTIAGIAITNVGTGGITKHPRSESAPQSRTPAIRVPEARAIAENQTPVDISGDWKPPGLRTQ